MAASTLTFQLNHPAPGQGRDAREGGCSAKGLCLAGAGVSSGAGAAPQAQAQPPSCLLKADASGPSLRKRQTNQTQGQQVYGVALFPSVSGSGAGALPSLGKQKLGAWPSVGATAATGLVLEVAGKDICRLQQITFSLVVLLLERSTE